MNGMGLIKNSGKKWTSETNGLGSFYLASDTNSWFFVIPQKSSKSAQW
jgi:hypothetical protein